MFVEIGRHISGMQLDGIPPDDDGEKIYTFRIRLQSDTSLWIHLQIPEDFTLHDMYIEIVEQFHLKDNDDYSIYHDKTENRFVEYTSDKHLKRGKKFVGIALSDLDFERQKQMLMVAHNQAIPFGPVAPTMRFEIELMHIKPADEEIDYPRVSRVSAGMKLY